MKKLFIAIAAIVICFSMTLTSFAAVTSFMQFFDEKTGYVYLFGKFDEGDTAAGFEIDGTAYLLDNEEEDENNKTAFERANEGRRMFGIGLIDKFNLLSSTYTATPYSLNASGTAVRGAAVTVNNPELTDNYLSDIQIDGESITGFDPEKSVYYLSVNSESDISVNSFTVTTAKEYASASVAKTGSDYVITSTAPDSEERTTTIKILTNKTYQENEAITASAYRQIAAEATTPEVVTLTEGESRAAVRFDISELVSINDRAKITISAARNKDYDTVLKVYGTASEGALDSAAGSVKIGESDLLAYADQDEENLTYSTRTFDVTDYLTGKILNGDTTATIVIEIEGEGSVYVRNLASAEIKFTDWKGSLASLTVGGKAAPGFYTGTLNDEFYYGVSEMPETASELPAVSASATEGTTAVSTEEEYGGYVANITVNQNGISRVYKIHFREFDETQTETVQLIRYYRVRNNYISDASNYTNGSTAHYYFNTHAENIYTTNNSSLGYAYFNINEKSGYAPVYYDFNAYYSTSGTSEGTNGYTAYGIDMDLTNVTLPDTGETSANNPFKYFAGFNSSDAFKIKSVPHTSQGNNFTTTAAVKPGKNIIIFKSDEISSSISRQIHYYGSYTSKIQVKYVEKNPVNPEDSNADLSSISVDGTAISEFGADTTEYYVPVEDEENPSITVTAAPQNAEAAADVSLDSANRQYVIIVTAKDGETTKAYYVKYRTLITETKTASSMTHETKTSWGSTSSNAYGSYLSLYNLSDSGVLDSKEYNGKVGVALFELSNSSQIKLLSMSVKPKQIGYKGSTTETLPAQFSYYQPNDSISFSSAVNTTTTEDRTTTTLKGSYWTAFKGLTDSTNDFFLGAGATYTENNTAGIKTSLDFSKVKIYDTNKIIMLIKKANGDSTLTTNNIVRYFAPSIEVSYIVCD